jgi:transglutaminase-like putative cysteine protease
MNGGKERLNGIRAHRRPPRASPLRPQASRLPGVYAPAAIQPPGRAGYLHNPSAADDHTTAVTGARTTHAWAVIYLPGAGWIAYDPTNGTIGGGDLIRVAVTRDISQAVPIAGSFIGTSNDYLGMTVDVSVVSENRGRARMASRS